MTLAIAFTGKGYEFRQLKRVGMSAIYSRKSPRMTHGTFEAIRVKEQKEKEAFGVTFEEKEAYPSTGEFGRLAWACATRERAEVRFAALVASENRSGGGALAANSV